MKTADFLAEIIRLHCVRPTKYALWKYMNKKYGWSEGTVNNYFKGATFPGEDQALQIAAELELDQGYVLACIEAERAKNPAVRAAWEAAAERLKTTKKRRGPSKAAKVAAVILSIGFVAGMVTPDYSAAELTDNSGNYRHTHYQAPQEGIGPMCIMSNGGCAARRGLAFAIVFCLVLSLLFLRQAIIDRGRRSTHDKNNKNDAVKGLFHDGRDIAGLPHPRRIITGAGGNIVRLFPENLPPPRNRNNPTGRRASVTAIRSRIHSRLAGLSHRPGSSDHTGRQPAAQEPAGQLAVHAAESARTGAHAGTENRRTRGAAAAEPGAQLLARLAAAADATRISISLARSPAAQESTRRSLAALLLIAATLQQTAQAAPGVSVGIISEHHGSRAHYDETNPGICIESGFTWYMTGCIYQDSHSKPAGLVAGGGRLSVTDWLHVGAGFGLRFRQAIDANTGQEFIDPDPAAAATLTIGTEHAALHFIRTPEIELDDATLPAVTWLQARFGF